MIEDIKDISQKLEINNLEFFNKILPFPLLEDYLNIINIKYFKYNYINKSDLFLFIRIVGNILIILVKLLKKF